MKRRLGLLPLLLMAPAAGAAQDSAAVAPAPPAVTLSLADALQEARRNSPTYRQTVNDAGPARWGVRSAYASLLPSVNVSSQLGYTGAGQANFGGGFVRPTSAFLTSNYSLGLAWQLDGRVLSAPGRQKALQHATEEDIGEAVVGLRSEITTQYLNTLQATAQVGVAKQQVTRNVDFLRLAKARFQVGQGTLLEVRQAEVIKGQSDVGLLRAVQAENEAKLDLLRRMGVEPPAPVEQIALTDSFPLTTPNFRLDSLLRMANDANPSLKAVRARQSAATWGVRAAKSEFLPRLDVQAGWSGFTQQFTNENVLLTQTLGDAQLQAADCQYNNQVRTALSLGGVVPDCFAASGLGPSGGALLDPVSQQVRSANGAFPFRYTGQPFQAILQISLPIFTGLGRSLRLSQARAQEDDADEFARARRLQVHSDVHARSLGAQTSYKAIAVQSANRSAARDQLRLAQDRYRLGAWTSLEVADAQNAVQRAEGDYVNSVYDYHKAVAALEAAVGRPLR